MKESSFYSRAALAVASLALLVALFGSATTLRVANRSSHTADQTREALAAALDAGKQRRTILHNTDKQSCDRIHQLDVGLRSTVRRSIAATRAFAPVPGVITQAQLDASIRSQQQSLRELAKADCLSVPSLTVKPKTNQ